MTVDWNVFTPWASLAGGVLIGVAAAMLMLLNGRIAGISGILTGVFSTSGQERFWRASFVAGLLAAPLFWWLVVGRPEIRIDAEPEWLVVAGLLVGTGTRLGSGCTSGHGVCGIARLSRRSLVATLTFMLSGFVTVWMIRHVLGSHAL